MQIHDAGEGWVADVGRYWCAATFPSANKAKAAWEQITSTEAKRHIGVWRTMSPRPDQVPEAGDPPEHKHTVWLMAEKPERLAGAIRILRRRHGRPVAPEDVEEGMIDSLRTRRARASLEAPTVVIRTPGGRVLHPGGAMSPYRRPQG
jgi:hypothetical protein